MLEIVVPAADYFDESTQKFVDYKAQILQLEHSLVTLSKWESKWEIPYLSRDEKTQEQTMDYIRMMTVNEVPSHVYGRLSKKNFDAIVEYINSKQTATWFSDDGPKQIEGRSTRVITSELIYYWMIALNIPFECQHWHLSRLLTLIRVCNAQMNPEKSKKSRSEIAAERRRLNEQRRKQLGTKG